MSPEPHPIDLDMPPPEAVVEFGAAPVPRRRWSAIGFGRGMLADRRFVPVAAALAAVAILASLVSEWQVTTVHGGGEVGDKLLPTDVIDLGALGTGYLVGLFPLIAAVVLTMFGPPVGRRYSRLTGLSVGGTLLGLLFALATMLGGESRIITWIYTIQLDDNQMKVGYGRGLWCAFAGVLLAMVALYLADRHLPVAPRSVGAPVDDDEPAAVWSWRRPPDAPDELDPDEPLELTVAPAKPFTSLSDDRDKPNGSGRGGISG